MTKARRKILITGMLASLVLCLALAGLYGACQQAPAFYKPALAEDKSAAKTGSDDLLHEAASLASNLRRSGQWQALFTAQQINGWLACDMLQNHPALLPPTITDPRVAIENDRAQIAFRWHKLAWSAVVYLETEIYLSDVNVVAIRICKAKAGLLPLPLKGLLDDLTTSAVELGLEINQQQIDGDPLVLITLPPANDPEGKLHLTLEALEVYKGEIYLAGRSDRSSIIEPLARQPEKKDVSSGKLHSDSENIQR